VAVGDHIFPAQDTMGTALPLLERHWCKGQPSTGRLLVLCHVYGNMDDALHYMLSQAEENWTLFSSEGVGRVTYCSVQEGLRLFEVQYIIVQKL
jgi:hypothetical protein